jgi:hypothetical protein
MPNLVARILLSLLVIPLGVLCYFSTYVAVDQLIEHRGLNGRIETGMFTWAFVAACWWWVWRRDVGWTTRRVGWTVGVTVIAFGMGVAGGAFVSMAFAHRYGWTTWDNEIIVAYASFATPTFWLIGASLAWREYAAERMARLGGARRHGVVCPACGYDLTGLSESRCPECGARYTLDELLASRPDRAAAAAELES